MPEATLTTKGQVTIPKPVRDHLKLATGARLSFIIQNDGSVTLKAVTRHVRDLAGLLQRPRRGPVSVKAMDEGIAEQARQKFGRRK